MVEYGGEMVDDAAELALTDVSIEYLIENSAPFVLWKLFVVEVLRLQGYCFASSLGVQIQDK